MQHENMNLSAFKNFTFHTVNYFSTLFSNFPLMQVSLIFCLCLYLLCLPGSNHFDAHFRRIGPVLFPSKDGKNAVREGRNGQKGVFSRQSRHLFLYK